MHHPSLFHLLSFYYIILYGSLWASYIFLIFLPILFHSLSILFRVSLSSWTTRPFVIDARVWTKRRTLTPTSGCQNSLLRHARLRTLVVGTTLPYLGIDASLEANRGDELPFRARRRLVDLALYRFRRCASTRDDPKPSSGRAQCSKEIICYVLAFLYFFMSHFIILLCSYYVPTVLLSLSYVLPLTLHLFVMTSYVVLFSLSFGCYVVMFVSLFWFVFLKYCRV